MWTKLKKLKTKTKKLKGIVFLASDKLAIKEFSSTPLSKFFKDFQISVPLNLKQGTEAVCETFLSTIRF